MQEKSCKEVESVFAATGEKSSMSGGPMSTASEAVVSCATYSKVGASIRASPYRVTFDEFLTDSDEGGEAAACSNPDSRRRNR